jgi:hypothetical protein
VPLLSALNISRNPLMFISLFFFGFCALPLSPVRSVPVSPSSSSSVTGKVIVLDMASAPHLHSLFGLTARGSSAIDILVWEPIAFGFAPAMTEAPARPIELGGRSRGDPSAWSMSRNNASCRWLRSFLPVDALQLAGLARGGPIPAPLIDTGTTGLECDAVIAPCNGEATGGA